MLKILLILGGTIMAGMASLGMALTGPSDEPLEQARGDVFVPIVSESTASPTPSPTPTATPTAVPTSRPSAAPTPARTVATPKPKTPEPKVTAPPFPTPKPTPKPTPTSSPNAASAESREQVKTAIRTEWQGDDNKAIAVADCESSLNTRASSPNGINLGLWQIRQQTWEDYGGTGDPRDHTAAHQTRIAWKVFQARGWAAWPGCA